MTLFIISMVCPLFFLIAITDLQWFIQIFLNWFCLMLKKKNTFKNADMMNKEKVTYIKTESRMVFARGFGG